MEPERLVTVKWEQRAWPSLLFLRWSWGEAEREGRDWVWWFSGGVEWRNCLIDWLIDWLIDFRVLEEMRWVLLWLLLLLWKNLFFLIFEWEWRSGRQGREEGFLAWKQKQNKKKKEIPTGKGFVAARTLPGITDFKNPSFVLFLFFEFSHVWWMSRECCIPNV